MIISRIKGNVCYSGNHLAVTWLCWTFYGYIMSAFSVALWQQREAMTWICLRTARTVLLSGWLVANIIYNVIYAGDLSAILCPRVLQSICIYTHVVALQLNSATLSKTNTEWSGDFVALSEVFQATLLVASFATIWRTSALTTVPVSVNTWEVWLREKRLNRLSFRKIIVAFLKERKWNPEIALS